MIRIQILNKSKRASRNALQVTSNRDSRMNYVTNSLINKFCETKSINFVRFPNRSFYHKLTYELNGQIYVKCKTD